ncbi:hypothetical protein ASPVEDRAFT_87139 [Aspergillus versicolor CBS 583.65]|uniref:RNase III domain-containing protein n=1 Tax=Aspergillus versicolor CBS 583.65 TaxID=1036611 RepID=A0A1L9PW78_ASPVE|nr:uncharacterized protein ASPVEDRAFT_87139 [Aspergillus versicolor CBS 583.65]OJJ05804.1 hypothetical protein ASPVEDRAFT_87139 [Aspergillus versicolor CBS 583.65]
MPSLIAATMEARAHALEELLGLRFNNIRLLIEALIAPGVYSPEGNRGHGLFGDTAIQLALQREGRKREQRVERISTVVSKIASNENLIQRALALTVDQYILNNPSQGTFVPPKLIATTMEAIVGAYFLDQELDFAALLRVLAALGLSWPDFDS